MRGYSLERPDPTASLNPIQRNTYETKRLAAWVIYKAATGAASLLHWSEAEKTAADAPCAYRLACEEAYREVAHGLVVKTAAAA